MVELIWISIYNTIVLTLIPHENDNCESKDSKQASGLQCVELSEILKSRKPKQKTKTNKEISLEMVKFYKYRLLHQKRDEKGWS
jgi:hypothetical protein